jgi:fructuronate reductase
MTGRGRRRLNARTVVDAHAGPLPDYDRTGAPVIAHLGFGAFARAHLAVYADELLREGQPGLIRGVSLRSRRAQDQLEPQDGLFSVAVREPGEGLSVQVIGALSSVETGATAALDAMAAPTTRLVTLTITEKGYEAAATLHGGHPPDTAPALIARALHQRRQYGIAPPIFASLDNLLDNGSTLRARVLEAANLIDRSLGAWIAHTVQFPSSVVDRMVPAPTEQDLDDIAEALGLTDEAAVAAERHRSWIIRATDGLEFLEDVGVELVDDIAPFERRKLWLLNGPHSAAAYGGLLAGYATIAGAVGDDAIARFVRGLVADTLEVAAFPAALHPAAFADDALRRFANPALGHTCAQVGADGSSKLRQRLLPIVEARASHSLGTERFAAVAAIWLAAAAGVDVRGRRLLPVDDPLAGELRSALAGPDGLRALSRVAFGDTLFGMEVALTLQRLTGEGASILEGGP